MSIQRYNCIWTKYSADQYATTKSVTVDPDDDGLMVLYTDHVAALRACEARVATERIVNTEYARGRSEGLDAAWNAVAAHDCDPESTTHCNCQLAGMDAIDALRGES